MCAFKLNSNWLTLLFTCFYLVGWCDVSNGAFAWTSVRVWRKSCGQHPAIPVASTRAWRDRSNGTWWVLSCCCRVLTAAGGSGADWAALISTQRLARHRGARRQTASRPVHCSTVKAENSRRAVGAKHSLIYPRYHHWFMYETHAVLFWNDYF